MTFDILTIPFSCRGSFWAFSTYMEAGHRQLYLKNVRESCAKTDYKLFKVELFQQGKAIEYICTGFVNQLKLHTDTAEIIIFFSDENTICLHTSCTEISVKFSLLFNGGYSYFYQKRVEDTTYTVLNLPQNRINMAIDMQRGNLVQGVKQRDISFVLQPDAKGILAVFTEFEVELLHAVKIDSMEQCLQKQMNAFLAFQDAMLPTPSEQAKSRMLAAYILWSCHVKKSRFLPREAIYMSKNDMCNIWSWDNCMIAIALAAGQGETALNQLKIPLDYQDENGAIPDYVNDVFCLYNFCKPPIYGWALQKIEQYITIDDATLRQFYQKLSENTKWWFQFRDSDGDGVCEYLHGNDSGWDNSTLFLGQPPVETPDLQTFLILQMDYLISCCKRLGLKEDLQYWQDKQKNCLEAMIQECFVDNFSVAKQSGTHEITAEKSLICFIPLMLGERLPNRIREKLLHELQNGKYITEYGLATEPMDSIHYDGDGYWRGPIWGISTLMVAEGLAVCGETALAKEIAQKFANLVAKSGMAENFDAISGQARKDKAFTWTSACYFYLSNRYLMEK